MTIEQLKAIIKPYVQNQEAFESISPETDFLRDLNINSANLVDIILDIEEKYNILIENETMQKMLNVQSAMDVIEEHLVKDDRQ